MTDTSAVPFADPTGCPDFEALSCHADGELGGRDADAVAAHVEMCVRCQTLVERLHAGAASDAGRRAGAGGGAGCPGEERLVAYATGALGGDDRAAVSAHVAGCDACVESLMRLHRRLGASTGAPDGIPVEVARRAQAALPAALAELAAEDAAPPRLRRGGSPRSVPGRRAHVAGWRNVSAFAPVALAAMALFALAVGLRPSGGPADVERSRALPTAALRLRVTADQVPLYSRPSGRSEVVGSVARGATVAVAGEERGWYQVRLDDGRSGWALREAFE